MQAPIAHRKAPPEIRGGFFVLMADYLNIKDACSISLLKQT